MPTFTMQGPAAQIQFASKEDFLNWVNLSLYEPAAAFGFKLILEPIKPDEVKVARG